MSAASVFPARALLPGASFQVLNLPSHYCSSPHTTQRTPSLFVAREKDCTVMYFAQTLYIDLVLSHSHNFSGCQLIAYAFFWEFHTQGAGLRFPDLSSASEFSTRRFVASRSLFLLSIST